MSTEPPPIESKTDGWSPKPFVPPQVQARLDAMKEALAKPKKPKVEKASGVDDRKLVIALAVLGVGAFLYHRHTQSEKKEARRQELALARAERRAIALAQLSAPTVATTESK